MVRAAAHLLVGRDAHGNPPVGQLRMIDQVFHGGQDLGHAGFVVRSEEGGPVCDDQVPAHILFQTLKVRFPHDHALREGDISPLVMDDLRFDAIPRRIGRGIHVGDEPHAGDTLTARGGREPAVNIAVLVHLCPVEPDLGELLRQRRPQKLLLGGGGYRVRVLCGLCIKGDIPQKTFYHIHTVRSFPVRPVIPPLCLLTRRCGQTTLRVKWFF